ncbi:uncharacterized protein LOC110748822 isoform X2 [Prunus avium]|uniref:Uncharacterized protein LOC110748822 isoform X2 n=1 Tax=Prunus avium TaxID=42229 RepID=A0A6P5RND8_PRUAV|nr:uncharacterized protein LOC110748822 isoform X2 [Prunus avium]
MAKNSGVFIRQLLGNCNHPSAAGLLHHLHRKPIQNLTLVSNTAPSSPQTIDIRSASKPLSYYSLHTPNLQFLQQRRCLSSLVDADSHTLLSGPSNLYVIETLDMHYRLRQKVEDERLSVVFFYTAPGCQATLKWITPIFDELCKQFQHITMAKVYMDKNGPGSTLDVFGVHRNMNGTRFPMDIFEDNHETNDAGSTLDKLGIHETPTFHCYLKGKRVVELVGDSARHLKKRLENVYNPSRMKERRRRDGSKVRAFAKGMFLCQEQRERLCKLEDPKARLEWFKSEMGGK